MTNDTTIRPAPQSLVDEYNDYRSAVEQQTNHIVSARNVWDDGMLKNKVGYGCMEVVIRIPYDAKRKDVENAITPAMDFRQWLLDKQLLRFEGIYLTRHSTLEHTSESQESGVSWQQLADDINASIAKFMLSWQIPDTGWAGFILELYEFTNTESREIVSAAKTNMRDGYPMFENGYPISVDRLRAVIRRWRESPERQHYLKIQQEDKRNIDSIQRPISSSNDNVYVDASVDTSSDVSDITKGINSSFIGDEPGETDEGRG